MIFLKTTRNDRASASRRAKKDGAYPEAVYDSKEDRILLLSAGKDITGIVNHEFMHRTLVKSRLPEAGRKWDSNMIYGLEIWLGWNRPNIIERLIRKFA